MNNNQAAIAKLSETLIGEILIFGLLGKALYEEPDRQWLEALIADQVFAEAPFGAEQSEIAQGIQILQQWGLAHMDGISDEHFAGLKMDYTRLFIGLDTLITAPWESVYYNRERMVFQEQTIQVRNWYARYGLQVEQYNREPDDHIGLEMSFVAHLATLALQALEADDQARLDELIQAQRDFLSEHPLGWAPTWAKRVKEHAETDFYRGMAYLSHGALLAAAAVLQVPLPKVVST